jgi:hypothetical protein
MSESSAGSTARRRFLLRETGWYIARVQPEPRPDDGRLPWRIIHSLVDTGKLEDGLTFTNLRALDAFLEGCYQHMAQTSAPQIEPDRLGAIESIQKALESLERGHFGTVRALLIDARRSLMREVQ